MIALPDNSAAEVRLHFIFAPPALCFALFRRVRAISISTDSCAATILQVCAAPQPSHLQSALHLRPRPLTITQQAHIELDTIGGSMAEPSHSPGFSKEFAYIKSMSIQLQPWRVGPVRYRARRICQSAQELQPPQCPALHFLRCCADVELAAAARRSCTP